MKLINPQNLARIPVHQQSYCSSSLTDKHHLVILMVTQHFNHLTLTVQPQTSLRITTWPHLIHPGRSNPTQVWMLWVMSHSNDISVRDMHRPSTHTQVQAELQTCTRLLLIQLPFPKTSHSASLQYRIPTINAALVHSFFICSMSRFYQPLSVQEITKLTNLLRTGASNSFPAQSKSELSLLK